ncbi:MAG: arginine decarboxylase [Thermosediminibacterales bacterium]|nr:arginine decarboxylase [Thermosediminibacterales bacterium]MDK2836321.1 arginine decarboxylase [Thermosediminibacterales bacterium]
MKHNNIPLIEALLEYNKKNMLRFHTPGHKGGKGAEKTIKDIFGKNVFLYDLTEVDGLDDLHNPKAAIMKAQELLSEVYGSDRSFFLVNGATTGVEAMLMAAAGPGEEVVIDRNCHYSAINGLILNGATPVYMMPEIDKRTGLVLGPSRHTLIQTLKKHPGAKALFIVSPTYFGICYDLKSISDIVHEHNIPLIVDEAHGPHLGFHPDFAVSAMQAGADACCQSPHKILGSFTQSSWLHVKGNMIDLERLKKALQVLQSSSPSYLLMASLDSARFFVSSRGRREFDRIISMVRDARVRINNITGLFSPQIMIGDFTIAVPDYTKLTVNVRDSGLNGKRVAYILRNEYKIQPEFADRDNLLFIITCGDNPNKIEALIDALKSIARMNKTVESTNKADWVYPAPKVEIIPRDAFFAHKRRVELKKAAGLISAETVAPYPPGVPLLAPGERITPEIVELILQMEENGIQFHGPEDTRLETIKTVEESLQ